VYDTPREGSLALTRRLSIRRRRHRLLLFGAESPHTEAHPFVIPLREVRSPIDILDWMKTIAGRGWGATSADLLEMARQLMDHLDRQKGDQ
jgi:hypothetical protein